MAAADRADVLTRPAPPPDQTLRYGPGPDQVADLRLPAGPATAQAGRTPVLVLLLHGGFWRAAYDRVHLGPLAAALAAESFLVCTPEYRRTGQPDGGWPGTFDDVAAAVDRLPGLACSVVPSAGAQWRVILAGHSAGGHLALWSAGRHRLGPGDRWHRAAAVPGAEVAGVVALAPVSDLAECYRAGLGNDAAAELLGGGPTDQPRRYTVTDPARLVPLGVPVRLVHGTADDRVPFAMSRSFTARAQAAGDDIRLAELPGGGHFDVIDPLSAAWPAVLGAFRSVAGWA